MNESLSLQKVIQPEPAMAVAYSRAKPRLQRLTRLGQQLFDCKIVLIGFHEPSQHCHTLREGTHSGDLDLASAIHMHNPKHQGIQIVSDLALDSRLAGNPLLAPMLGLVFFAAAPITDTAGKRIGSFCLLDDRRQGLTDSERQALQDLACCVEDEIKHRSLQHLKSNFEQENLLADVIGRAQLEFTNETDTPRAFHNMLKQVLHLTGSELAFIGEVMTTPEETMYLKIHAYADEVKDQNGSDFFRRNAPVDLEFHNLDSLFGAAILTGEPVIANDPANDSRRAGLPPGHPPVESLLALPIHHGNELVALLAIANRPGGYDRGMQVFLAPLLITVGQLIVTARTKQRHEAIERRLHATIEGTRTATWEWDLETGKTVFNERWAEILGYTLEELQPSTIKTWEDLTHPNDLKHAREVHARHFDGTTDYMDVVIRMKHRLGHWIWVNGRGRVVKWGGNGEPLLMLGIYTDITARKHAEMEILDQARHTNTILENIVDGIVTFDKKGRIDSCNPAARRIFGYEEEKEIKKLNIADLLPGIQPNGSGDLTLKNLPSRLMRDGDTDDTGEGRCKDGTQFPLEVSISKITRKNISVFVATVRDITERKRVERMKSEFVSTVSHELRTPLTSIVGSLGLVANGVLGELPVKAGEMLTIAHKNSQRLTHLINDLLDMEKLVAGKMHFDMKPQPLMPLIHQALETNRVVGEETRVIINLINEAESATVHMDANRLFQVMSNLLSNAIKFSPAGGEVNVTARMDQNMVRVSVADQGPGIKHEFRRRIFQKFAQGDSSTTRNKGGTGLGLSISREIIQRMLGNLHFESVEGQGSTFYFELPLWNPTPVQITSVPDQPEHKTTKPRILVVEDDPDIAHLLGLILEHAGYASDIAPTGAQALNALQTRHYDAMTLDLLLPDSNGLELIRQIQRQPRTAKLPIIVVSGNMEDHRLAINDELSEVEWVTKPIDQSRLRRLLEDMLISAPNAPPQLARSLHSRNDPTSKRFME